MSTIFSESEVGLMAEARAGSKLDYGIDWSDFLALTDGDTIASVNWTAEETGLTLTSQSFSGALAVVWIEALGTARDWFTTVCEITTTGGRKDSRVALLYVKPPATGTGSAIFKNRIVAIAQVRRDRLAMAASGALPEVTVSDEYIWDKLMAAESEIAHTLRVPLQPTRFFPQQPSQEEIDALALEGTPWEVESSPDYTPDMFTGDRWGYIITRQKPIVSVEDMKFVYPTELNGYFDIPNNWLSIDAKYGHIRIVPTSNAMMTGLAGMSMLGLTSGRAIPSMVRITYTAGLKDVSKTYPELVDCVKKKAITKLIADAFLPQSGSISADGLSESISTDMSKYHESIDHILNGADGNGGLMAEIHGIRMMVM